MARQIIETEAEWQQSEDVAECIAKTAAKPMYSEQDDFTTDMAGRDAYTTGLADGAIAFARMLVERVNSDPEETA